MATKKQVNKNDELKKLEKAKLEEEFDKDLNRLPDRAKNPGRTLPFNESWRKDETLHSIAERFIKMGDSLIEEAESRNEKFRKISDEEELSVEKFLNKNVDIYRIHHTKKQVDLNEDLKDDDFLEQITEIDQAWDEAMAKAINEFDKANVDSTHKVQLARANWLMAVRLYETELRNAWAVFKTRADHFKKDHSGESCNDAFQEVNFFKQSSALSDDLLTYFQARANATNDLATAFGDLVKDLGESSTDLELGQATFFQAEQSAYEVFWTSVLNALNPQS